MKRLQCPSTDPCENMAIDQWMLEEAEGTLLRLWQNTPVVVIGRNQCAHTEANLDFLARHGIALVRRTTGGGAVYHDLGNLNYTLSGPVGDAEAAADPFLDRLVRGLRRLGAEVRRSGRNDLLLHGDRKCSGYAKRICKGRQLIHGTLLWSVDLDTMQGALSVPGGKWEAAGVKSVHAKVANLSPALSGIPHVAAFQKALESLLMDEETQTVTLDKAAWCHVQTVAREQFGSWEWTYGHAPDAEARTRGKFPCGTISLSYRLHHGRVEQVQFSGDFLGQCPAEELARQMEGLTLEEAGNLSVEAYFDGMGAAEWQSLLQGGSSLP